MGQPLKPAVWARPGSHHLAALSPLLCFSGSSSHSLLAGLAPGESPPDWDRSRGSSCGQAPGASACPPPSTACCPRAELLGREQRVRCLPLNPGAVQALQGAHRGHSPGLTRRWPCPPQRVAGLTRGQPSPPEKPSPSSAYSTPTLIKLLNLPEGPRPTEQVSTISSVNSAYGAIDGHDIGAF